MEALVRLGVVGGILVAYLPLAGDRGPASWPNANGMLKTRQAKRPHLNLIQKAIALILYLFLREFNRNR